jgi:catechol 2,3-dioxygenase-like lactoylglutathione lyase family enzyme
MTFIVRDLDRMEAILTTVLDARKVYDSGAQTFSLSKERFFLVGDGAEPIWIATMEGEPLPTRTYNHVAFKIADTDYETFLQRVRQLGLEVREGRSRVPGEGQSIYFYDDDNHMFELHTGTLDERLKRYAKGR